MMMIECLQDIANPNQVYVETVAKFAVPDPGLFWRLQMVTKMAGYQLSTQKFQDVYDIYLDTKNEGLLAAGYNCRRRILPTGMSMIISKLNEKSGLFRRRQKLEVAIAAGLPPAKWPRSLARELVLQLSGQQLLIPLFRIQLTRIVRVLQGYKRVQAQFNLDIVSLIANDEVHTYHELVVELLPSIPVQILTEVIDCFQNEWHLQPEPRSKFQRAMELLN